MVKKDYLIKTIPNEDRRKFNLEIKKISELISQIKRRYITKS
mgnify:CR=1 FL=1